MAFFNHLITTLATHSMIDIRIRSKGDLKHHIIEDVAICLGEAVRKAVGDGNGITRFGWAAVPMDCSLAVAAFDYAKRPYSRITLRLHGETVEDIACEDIHHFLETLSSSLQANIHINVRYGKNDHHKAEAAFKALALSLRQALTVDPRRKGSPSAKGVL